MRCGLWTRAKKWDLEMEMDFKGVVESGEWS